MRISVFLLAVGVAFPAHAALRIPELKPDALEVPIIPAEYASVLVIDVASGKTLYKLEPSKVWPAASLTKLLTSRVFTSTPTSWDGTANIIAKDEVEGGRLQVVTGTKLSFRDLLYSAMIGSANNAANALARWFDGRGVPAFIDRMNKTAAGFGLATSHFVDASGISANNVTTAYDIAVLLGEASSEPETQKAMVMPAYSFTTRGPVVNKTIKNTNELLFYEPSVIVTAGKTGFINESRYNYTARMKPHSSLASDGGELIVVVFGSATRKAGIDASAALAKWAWSAFTWDSATGTLLSRNYEMGDKGEEIKNLQQYLNTNGFQVATTGPGSSGKETTLFGALTKAALKRFQEAHADEVLTPYGRTAGSGYLDFSTRFLIHKMSSTQ